MDSQKLPFGFAPVQCRVVGGAGCQANLRKKKESLTPPSEMAIQQNALPNPVTATGSYSSDSTSTANLSSSKSKNKSLSRSQSHKNTSHSKQFSEEDSNNVLPPPPIVTRNSTTSLVTLSLSLSGDKKSKKSTSQRAKKKSIFVLPPVENSQLVKSQLVKKHERKQKTVKFQDRPSSLMTHKTIGLTLPEIAPTGIVNELQPKFMTHRTFIVHYFPQETIRVKVDKNEKWHCSSLDDDGITYAKLKHTAALALRIELTSLNFFGLFLGQLGDPKELCIDDAAVPQSVKEVCFQRLILVMEKEERYYLSRDDRAMGLIFWELKDQYDRGQIIPLPSKEKSTEMERILLTPHYGITMKKKFVNLVLGFPQFYWSYYHKANYCILQSSIWPGDFNVCKGTVVHVVPGREKLIFLDISGEVQIEALPWHRIRTLTMKNEPIMTIDFELLLVTKGRCLPRYISVATDCNKFLYTVSIYMLRILQSRDINGHLLPPVDPYVAKQLHLRSMDEAYQSSEHILLSSAEVTAIAFDKLDLTDDGLDKKFRNKYCFRGPVYFKSKSCISFWNEYIESSNEEESDTALSGGIEQYEGYDKDSKNGADGNDTIEAIEETDFDDVFLECIEK